MKHLIIYILLITTGFSFAQTEKKEKQKLDAQKKANNFVYQANELVNSQDYIAAEMAYRKAISKQPESIAGTYNLGHSYYEKGHFEEALFRHEQATKSATTKTEKHKAFHNIGNIFMQNKQCKEAVEAYKNALRNDPSDDETRYNLAMAKACAEQQKENQKDEDKKDEEKKDENKEEKEKEGDNKKDQDKKKEGDDKKDEDGKPKDDKKDDGKGNDKKKEKQKPKQKPGQLSSQQIKNLLEAMNNQEQKVQEKMNAEKQKGAKVKTEKDW